MAFDGIMLRAVARELQDALAGGRISRVYQPEPHEVRLEVFACGATRTLLISCHPRHARAHLTETPRSNPRVPPAFCMFLRKHLEGGRIEAVEQEGLERTLRITVAAVNESGDAVRLTLVAELMGKHSNIILLDETGRILDALKRVPGTINRHREVLAGRPYLPPPAQGKADLTSLPSGLLAARWGAALRTVSGPRPPAWRHLLNLIGGLGPVNAREALHRAGIDPEADAAGMAEDALATLEEALSEMAADVRRGAFTPTARRTWMTPGDPASPPRTPPELPQPAPLPGLSQPVPDYSALALTMLPPDERIYEASPSRLLDLLYSRVEAAEALAGRRHQLQQTVANLLERLQRKLLAQEEERGEAAAAEEYRICGELLTANLHRIRPGMTEVRVQDYYDPRAGERVITLDPCLGPAANAQAYFKRYRKAKRSLAVVEEKLARTLADIRYLEGIEAALETVETAEEMAEVADELAAYCSPSAPERQTTAPHRGRRKPGAGRNKQADRGRSAAGDASPPAGRPLAFISSEGFTILVGKNNRQNDYLTMRLAAPDDLWLHAKDIPGSHVVIKRPAGGRAPAGVGRAPAASGVLEAVPPRTLEEAAMLAVHYSKARHSGKVPVDVTYRRFVRKPRGARPGFVVYTDQRTLYVTPDPAVLRSLRQPPSSPP